MTGKGGRWGEFLKACGIIKGADRAPIHAIRGTRFAKTAPGTVLTGLSIKAAIKLLSPPKPATEPKQITKPESPIGKPGKRVTRVDIVESWLAASSTDHTKMVDSIGLDAWLAAMPESWLPLLVERLAERCKVIAPVTIDFDVDPKRSEQFPPWLLDRQPAATPVVVEEEPPVAVITGARSARRRRASGLAARSHAQQQANHFGEVRLEAHRQRR